MLWQRFLSLMLLLSLPTLAMPMRGPQHRWPLMGQMQKPQSRPIVKQGINAPWRSKTFKYNDVLTFLEELESGQLEKVCNDQDLEQINHFLVFLAREGFIPNWGDDPQELEYDIEELLGTSDPYSFRYAPAERTPYKLTPAIYDGYHETLTCGWFKKAWSKTKKFCKKHKKAIIIGAVVVVAVATVVTVAVIASSSAAAGAAAAAGAGEAGGAAAGAGGAAAAGAAVAGAAAGSKDKPDEKEKNVVASRSDQSPPPPTLEAKEPSLSDMSAIVEKHCKNFKEAIAQERPVVDLTKPDAGPLPFEEISRAHGAHATQAACQEVIETMSPPSVAPSLLEREALRVASMFGLVDQKVGIMTDDGRVVEIPGAQMSYGLAIPAPGPAVAAAVIGGSYAAYEVGDNPSLQKLVAAVGGGVLASESPGAKRIRDGVSAAAGYLYSKAAECVQDATEYIQNWSSDVRDVSYLETRTGEGFVDGRIIPGGGAAVPLSPERIQEIVDKSGQLRKGDRTRAGRALDKHGNRPGSLFPIPIGSAQDVNEQGKKIVEEIVSNPDAKVFERERGGRDIRLPDGRGVRLNKDDELMGFLGPDGKGV